MPTFDSNSSTSASAGHYHFSNNSSFIDEGRAPPRKSWETTINVLPSIILSNAMPFRLRFECWQDEPPAVIGHVASSAKRQSKLGGSIARTHELVLGAGATGRGGLPARADATSRRHVSLEPKPKQKPRN
jgi:hypothetical protein